MADRARASGPWTAGALVAIVLLGFLPVGRADWLFAAETIAVGAVCFALFREAGRVRGALPRLALPLALIAYFALSTLWSAGLDPWARASMLMAGFATAAFFLLAWIECSRMSPQGFLLASRLMLGAALLSVLIVLLNWAIFHPEWLFVRRLRAVGVLNRANMGAFVLCALAVLAQWRLSEGRTVAERSTAAAFLVLSALLILLSGSRGGLATFALSQAAFFVLHRPLDLRRCIIMGGFGLAALAGVALLYFGDILPEKSRLFARPSGAFRLAIWNEAIALWQTRPIFGHGAGTEQVFAGKPEHPHSIWVAALFYGGVVGLALTAATIVLALVRAMAVPERERRALVLALMAVALLATLAHGTLPISRARDFWLFFWLPLALAFAQGGAPQKDDG